MRSIVWICLVVFAPWCRPVEVWGAGSLGQFMDRAIPFPLIGPPQTSADLFPPVPVSGSSAAWILILGAMWGFRRRRKPTGRRSLLVGSLRGECLEDRRMLALIPPTLSSLPGAPVTLHMDFDGNPAFLFDTADDQWASGPLPGDNDPIPAFTMDADATDFSQNELDAITAIWKHTAEKFSPFQINVTTIPPVGNVYNDGVAVQIIVGGSVEDWLMEDAGGVAQRGGFTAGALSNTGFVFSADSFETPTSSPIAASDRHFIAETAAHEAGHLFGLYHQSVIDGAGNVLVEYSNGGPTTAPIMGGSSNNPNKRGIWFDGPASTILDDNPVYAGNQDDLHLLTNPGFINYRADDYGDFSSAGTLVVDPATGLVSGYGVIETNGDRDAWTFATIGPVFSLTVSGNPDGGMLAPTLELIPIGAATIPAVTLTETNTSATLTATGATPGGGYVLRVSPQFNAYGNLGQYFISGNAGQVAALSGGTLTVTPISGFNNNVYLTKNPTTNRVIVQVDIPGGSAVQQFDASLVNQIEVRDGEGDDTYQILAPLGAIPVHIRRIVANGGQNQLLLLGTELGDSQGLVNSVTAFNNSTPIDWTPGLFEEVYISGFAGDDIIQVQDQGYSLLNVTIYGDDGNDVISVAGSLLGNSAVRGPVSISGGPGQDTLNLAPLNTRVDAISAPVTFYGGTGVDTMIVGSGTLDAISGLVTYDGGGLENNVLTLLDYATESDSSYSITDQQVTRDSQVDFGGVDFTNVRMINLETGSGSDFVGVYARNVDQMTVNGNAGDDIFYLGDGNSLNGGVGQFNGSGGDGYDQLIFFDALSTHTNSWTVYGRGTLDPETVYLGVQRFATAGYEQVQIRGGEAGSQFNVSGELRQDVSILAGPGNDVVNLTDVRSYRNFWTQNNEPPFSHTLTVDGQAGFDVFSLNDAAAGQRAYYIDGRSLTTVEENSPQGLHLNYDEFQSVNVRGGNFGNEFFVSGSSASVAAGQQTTLWGGSDSDSFVVYPRRVDGSPSLVSPLGMLGGSGIDSITVDDSASETGADWTIENYFGSGTQNFVVAAGAYFGSSNDVEDVRLFGSAGDDVFYLDRYQSGTSLQVFGNDGYDRLEVTSTTLNVPAGITSISYFNFDGGEGYDEFLIHNENGPGGWDYLRTDQYFRAYGPGYTLTLDNVNVEYLYATGGVNYDRYFVTAVPADTVTAFDGGDGVNEFHVGNYGLTGGILGGLHLYATLGYNSVTIDNSADTVGRTVHVDVQDVGAAPDDDLFGPGGYLVYSNFSEPLTVRLGTGDDTVYVMPHPYTPIVIDDPNLGFRESTDFLGMAFANVSNPVFTSTGMNSGTYTFTDAASVAYTGIETMAIDDVAPEVLQSMFLETPWHRVLFEFSEDVSPVLRADDLVLIDLSTGRPIEAGIVELNYDLATGIAEFSFPGLPGGQLPAGNYRATLDDRVTDLFGNPLAPFGPLEFNVMSSVPDGDFNDDGVYDLADIDALVGAIAAATHDLAFDLTADGLVDLLDRDAWLAEAGSVNLPSGNAYLVGDANLDGVVDGADFIAWNAHKFTAANRWQDGDFNADGFVDGQDFILWNSNKFQSSSIASALPGVNSVFLAKDDIEKARRAGTPSADGEDIG